MSQNSENIRIPTQFELIIGGKFYNFRWYFNEKLGKKVQIITTIGTY